MLGFLMKFFLLFCAITVNLRPCLLLLLRIRSAHLEILEILWVMLINTGIFLRCSKLCGESRTYKVLLVSKKKIGGNHSFFRDN